MDLKEKSLGKLINFYRHQSFLKQEALAEQLGITQSLLSDIENDKVVVTVPMLLKFAETFKIPPSALLPEEKTNIFNNNFRDTSVNQSNILHQYGNFDEERKIFKELIAAKDELINHLKMELQAFRKEV